MTFEPSDPAATVFGKSYANQYDALYHDKDYTAECELVEHAFQRFAQRVTRRILDLGCGTGRHAEALARRGYHVTGVDRSTDMLAVAQQRAARSEVDNAKSGNDLRFYQADLRTVDLGETFDAALMMFAVLGYMTSTADALAALRGAHRHLEPGGLLIFDVWYGPAVLCIGPSDRSRVVKDGDETIIRRATGQLDVGRQVCTVEFQVQRLAGDRLVERTIESHPVRFFFPLELELLLHDTGFSLANISAFGSLDRPPNQDSWNVLLVARRL